VYTVAGDGSVYDSNGNQVGWTDPSFGGEQFSDISQLYISANPVTSSSGVVSSGPVAGAPIGSTSVAAAGGAGGSATSALSGLSALGSLATSIAKAINPTTTIKPGQVLLSSSGSAIGINPSTGLAYSITPSTQTSSLLSLAVIGAIVIFVIRLLASKP
jgi:hypothetical protein